MKEKELSSLAGSPKRRFTLSKSHILRGRQNFEELFSGSSTLHTPNVSLRYSSYPNADKKVLVGFIAPKRIGKAVHRNRTKRLLREAYRLNQHLITELPITANIGLHYAFMAKRAHLTFETVQNEVITLLEKLRKELLSETSSS